jgi:Tfp pilus assembly protein PilF
VWGQSVLFALQSVYAPVQRLVMEPDPGALEGGRSILGVLAALVVWVGATQVERDARPFLRRAAMAAAAALVPVLNFLPQETPLSERFFYLASGFALVPLGVLVDAAWRRRGAWRPAVALVTALALVGLVGISAWRARAWRTDRIVWKIATEEEPRRAAHWTHYGLALMQGREFRLAVGALQQAVELDPRNFRALHFLGMSLHQNGQPDAAVAAYTRALELQPRNIEAHLNIGLSFVGLYRFEEAYPHFVLAVQAQPDNVDALRLAGGCAMQTGRYAEAREYLDRGLRMVPNHPALRQARQILDEKITSAAGSPPAVAP